MNRFVLTVSALLLICSSGWAGSKWALLVGIDQYTQSNRISPLQGAGADAEQLAKTLEDVAGYPRDHVRLMTSKSDLKPAGNEIMVQLEALASNAQPDDTVFFFFAGHGVELDKVSYLLPADVDLRTETSLKHSALATSDVQNLLNSLKARTILLVFDMCRSDTRSHSRDNRAVMVTKRQVEDLTLKDDGVRQVVSLFACSPNQSSFEWPGKGRGYFSYFLEQGLRGEAKDDQGHITVGTLVSYLAASVPDAVKLHEQAEQTPNCLMGGPNPGSVVLASVAPKPPSPSPPDQNGSKHAIVRLTCGKAGSTGTLQFLSGISGGNYLDLTKTSITGDSSQPTLADWRRKMDVTLGAAKSSLSSAGLLDLTLPQDLDLDLSEWDYLTVKFSITVPDSEAFTKTLVLRPGDSIPIDVPVVTVPAAEAAHKSIKRLALAFLMYQNDYDDVIPAVADTHSAFFVLSPYAIASVGAPSGAYDIFRSMNPAGGRILFNVAFGGLPATSVDLPAEAPMFYDSLPWPDGTHLVAFMDGHAKFVSEEDWKKLAKYSKTPIGANPKHIPSKDGERFFKEMMHGKDHVDSS